MKTINELVRQIREQKDEMLAEAMHAIDIINRFRAPGEGIYTIKCGQHNAKRPDSKVQGDR